MNGNQFTSVILKSSAWLNAIVLNFQVCQNQSVRFDNSKRITIYILLNKFVKNIPVLSVKKQNMLYKDKTTSDLIEFWTNLYKKNN